MGKRGILNKCDKHAIKRTEVTGAVKKEKKRTGRGKALAAGAAVVLAAGAAVNGTMDLDELIPHERTRPGGEAFAPAHAQARTVLAELPDSEWLSLSDALRARFLRLPQWVKTAVLLPLWAVGSLPAALLGALGPVWSALLGLALQAGVLAGLFVLVYKLLFPNRKVRELFRRKNLKWLFVGAVTLTAADLVLTQLWTGWPVLRVLLLAGAGFGVLGLLWKRLCGKLPGPTAARVKNRLVMEWS